MGDAGPPTPLPEEELGLSQVRDIHVLVTGFGPFKSFTTNPSWLIASALPSELVPLPFSDPETETTAPQPQIPISHPSRNPLAALLGRRNVPDPEPEPNPPQQPLRTPNRTPYRIHIHTYSEPIRVAYDTTSVIVPALINPQTNNHNLSFDYVFHIGLASGRDSYTLATLGHRDEYVITDIDEQNGNSCGEEVWKRLEIPAQLSVGWEPQDVLRRWLGEVERRQNGDELMPERIAAAKKEGFMIANGMLGLKTATVTSNAGTSTAVTGRLPRKAVVKLSKDAGRYLCEFILMCSLVYRYREALQQGQTRTSPSPTPAGTLEERSEQSEQIQDQQELRPYDGTDSKLGKVAFLHVPNGIEYMDIAKGVMVAESAIKAVIASWEDGFRNPAVYSVNASDAVITSADKMRPQGHKVTENGFESKGTGDEIAVPTPSMRIQRAS